MTKSSIETGGALDAILLTLFTAELSYHHLPHVAHEICGLMLTAMILVHVWLNRRRLMSLTKKISPRKIFSLTINFLLTICAALTISAGVCVSNHLFAVSAQLHRNIAIHQAHVATPYVMMILLGVHVGLHWSELRGRLIHLTGEKIFRASVVMLAAIGLAGLAMNRVVDRILLEHIFATPATELNGAIFALMTVGGIIFFALITFLADKKIFGRR